LRNASQEIPFEQIRIEMNRRGMAAAKGSPKDEPGLGERTAIAATVLNKLREMAKKAAGRM
jgi:hypothetical protein